MAMSIEEFLNRPEPARKEPGCSSCGTPLSVEVTGIHRCAQGLLCDDCYFTALGEVLEAYPVGRASGHGSAISNDD